MLQKLRQFSSPVIVSAVLLFGIAFNLNLQDMGETYVSRNLFAWVVILLLVVHLWYRPLKDGVINWSPLWLGGLFLPAVGFVLILAGNIFASAPHMHAGHYLFPCMLLAFAMLIGGLLQHKWDETTKFTFILVALICFMPQFLIHLVTGNAFIFAMLPVDEITIHHLLYKPFAGFGQYNLYGSVYATLIIMACAAFVFSPVSLRMRLALLVSVGLMAIDLPFTKSSTALLGLFSGLAFLGAHVFVQAREKAFIGRYLAFIGYIGVISLIVITALAFAEQTDHINEFSARRSSFSINTRLTMWIIGLWGFMESPFWGHGLGSFLTIYLDQFGKYGVEAGLLYFPNVTIPHNIVVHVLAETGLIGFLALLVPFIAIAVTILIKADNRFLVLGVLAPILVHSQLEYPYIASGTHYWLLAIGLVFALGGQVFPERQFRFPSARINVSVSAFAALTVAAGIGIYTSLSLAASAAQTAHIFNETRKLSLDEYIANRFNEPDLKHPILGKRMTAIAHLMIVQKAMAERRGDVLERISVSALQEHVIPYYPTKQVWETMLRVYVVLRRRDEAMEMIDYIKNYMPAEAAAYEKFVRQSLPLEPPRQSPNRPQ